MRFKKITRLDMDGLVIRDSNQLTSFVNALRRIEARPYHDKVPDSQKDFECISRQVVYQQPNRLNVEESDLRLPDSRRVSYHVEF